MVKNVLTLFKPELKQTLLINKTCTALVDGVFSAIFLLTPESHYTGTSAVSSKNLLQQKL